MALTIKETAFMGVMAIQMQQEKSDSFSLTVSLFPFLMIID